MSRYLVLNNTNIRPIFVFTKFIFQFFIYLVESFHFRLTGLFIGNRIRKFRKIFKKYSLNKSLDISPPINYTGSAIALSNNDFIW